LLLLFIGCQLFGIVVGLTAAFTTEKDASKTEAVLTGWLVLSLGMPFFGIMCKLAGRQMIQTLEQNPGLGCIYGPVPVIVSYLMAAVGVLAVDLPVRVAGGIAGWFGFEIRETILTGDPEQVLKKQAARRAARAALPKRKLVAGLLGLCLPFGAHRFYLGYEKVGLAQCLVTAFTCGIGAVWSMVEGVLILTGKFNRDAQGKPLT
jgi:TM2 domain-containing membrane protein YozV